MRRRLLRRLAILGLIPYLTGLAPMALASQSIAKGTDVPLVFDQALSSKTAKEGDKVSLHVSQDVAVDGKTVIKQGTPVTGMVTKVEAARIATLRPRAMFAPRSSTNRTPSAARRKSSVPSDDPPSTITTSSAGRVCPWIESTNARTKGASSLTVAIREIFT